MKKATVICLCFVCVYFDSSLTLYAQNINHTFLPEHILPDTTLAVWVFPHLTTSLQKLTQNSPDADSYEPEESAIALLLSSVEQQFQRNFNLPFSSLAPIFEGTVAVALLDLLPPEQPDNAWPIPDFVFLADIHGASDTLKTILENHIIPIVQSQVPGVELKSESTNGITSYTLSNGMTQFSYALTEHLFVLGRSPESIQQLMIRASNARISPSDQTTVRSSLFHTETYQAPRERIFQQEHDSRLYADIQRIWRKLRPFIQQRCFSSQSPGNQLLVQLLDLYELTTLSWQFSYADNGGHEELFWAVSSPDEPIDKSFSLLSGFSELGNGMLTSDRILPGKTLYYGVSRIDVLHIWYYLNTLVETFLSPQQREQFQSKIAAFERHIQLDAENELFPSFGQEIAIACYEKKTSSQQQSFPTPEDFPCALLIQVAREDIIGQALRTLLTDVPPGNPQPESLTIRIPGVSKPVILYAAFVRDFLVLSVSRSVIQESLRLPHKAGRLHQLRIIKHWAPFFRKKDMPKAISIFRDSSDACRKTRTNQLFGIPLAA